MLCLQLHNLLLQCLSALRTVVYNVRQRVSDLQRVAQSNVEAKGVAVTAKLTHLGFGEQGWDWSALVASLDLVPEDVVARVQLGTRSSHACRSILYSALPMQLWTSTAPAVAPCTLHCALLTMMTTIAIWP